MKADVHDAVAPILLAEPDVDEHTSLQNRWARQDAADVLQIRKPSSDVYVGDGTEFIGNIHESEGIATIDNRMNTMIRQAARRRPEHSHRLGVACTKCGQALQSRTRSAKTKDEGPSASLRFSLDESLRP